MSDNNTVDENVNRDYIRSFDKEENVNQLVLGSISKLMIDSNVDRDYGLVEINTRVSPGDRVQEVTSRGTARKNRGYGGTVGAPALDAKIGARVTAQMKDEWRRQTEAHQMKAGESLDQALQLQIRFLQRAKVMGIERNGLDHALSKIMEMIDNFEP